MTRFLSSIERRVIASARGAYLAEITARRAAADAKGINFWVFVHTHDDTRYTEFTEGASEADVAEFAGGGEDLWRNIVE